MSNPHVAKYIAQLKDKDCVVRENAVIALEQIGNASAVPALIATLKDKDYYVRGRAAEALGKIGDASAVPALIRALKDRGSYVRRSAVEALGRIGDTQTLPLRVLCSTILSPAEKLNTLEALMRVRYVDDTVSLRYRLHSIDSYCHDLLNRTDIEAELTEGAGAVLTQIQWRTDRSIGVRSTSRDPSTDRTEGLRPASSVPFSIPPDQHLRPSEPSTQNEGKGSRVNRWFRRK